MRLVSLAISLALICAHGVTRAQESDTKAAQTAAEVWLSLVDKGSYAESWKTAASGFRKAVPQEKWEALVSAARTPFGKIKQRSLGSATRAKSLPGAPDGEYVVFDYSSSFEQKSAANERVTTVKDTDGVWRVVGYFVK